MLPPQPPTPPPSAAGCAEQRNTVPRVPGTLRGSARKGERRVYKELNYHEHTAALLFLDKVSHGGSGCDRVRECRHSRLL